LVASAEQMWRAVALVFSRAGAAPLKTSNPNGKTEVPSLNPDLQ
jgi:hypothetical protein